MFGTINETELYEYLKEFDGPYVIDTRLRAHNIFLDDVTDDDDANDRTVELKTEGGGIMRVNMHKSVKSEHNSGYSSYPDDLVLVGEHGRKISFEDCMAVKKHIEITLQGCYNNGSSYYYQGVEDDRIVW